MNMEDFGHGLSNILLTNKIKVMGDQMQEEELFGAEWKKEMNQYNKAAILESFAVIGIKAEHSKQLLGKAARTIAMLKRSIMAHPDHVENSEFWDFTDLAQELEDEIETHLKIT